MYNGEVYSIKNDDRCLLPIGVYRDGSYFREIVIDELTGLEQHALSDPKNKKNANRAVSHILRRIIQEIPGVMEQKSNAMHLIDARYVDEMFQADRDFLILAAFILSDENVRTLDFICPGCGEKLQEEVDLCDLDVYPHDHNEPPEVKVSLLKGVKCNDEIVKTGVFSFPDGRTQEKIAKYTSKGEHYVFSAILTQCLKLNNKTIDINQVSHMRIKDRNYLINIIQNIIPGVDLTIEVNCPDCGDTSEVGIDLTNFFLPEQGTTRRNKKRA